MFGNNQAPQASMFGGQQQQPSLFSGGPQAQAVPSTATGTGLFTQQAAPVTLGIQQPPQFNTQVAPTAQLPKEDEAQVLKDWKDKNFKLVMKQFYNKKSNDEYLKDLHSKMNLLNNRVQREFTKKYVLPFSSEQMNSDVSKTLTQNLTRMGVSINHIYYINDMLKGLNDKIRADKENRTNFTVQSYMKVGDLNCISSQKLLNMHRESVLNSVSYQLHSLGRVHQHSMKKLMNARTQIQATSEIKAYDFYTERNDQLVQGMFEKSGLDKLILDYNMESTKDIIKQIFDALANSSRVLNKEFKLLSIQMAGFQQGESLEQGRQLIIQNTVRFLEEEFRQGFNQFDLFSLNRQFQQVYLSQGQLEGYRIQMVNGVCPSGVLFMLARMGRLDLARKVFETWTPTQTPVVTEIMEFISFSERWDLSPVDVRRVYEGKLTSSSYNIDPVLKQLYLLKLQISEIEDLFEQVTFKKDKDLLLWLTLKTCHAELPEDYESEYMHITLEELQQTMPSQGTNHYMLEIQLQCYDRALQNMSHNLENYPQELAILLIIMNDTQLLSPETFQEIESKKNPISQVSSLLFSKSPLLASIILKRGILEPQLKSEVTDYLDRLARLFVKNKLQNLIVFDDKFKAQFSDQVLNFEGDTNPYLQKLIEKTIKAYFQEQLHLYFKQFLENVEKANNFKSVIESTQSLNQSLDKLAPYIQSIYQYRKKSSLITSSLLINEALFISLYAETLVFQILQNKYQKSFNDPTIIKLYQLLKYPETKDLHHLLRIIAQDISNEVQLQEEREMNALLDSLRIVEYFSELLQFIKRDRRAQADMQIAYDLLVRLELPNKITQLKQLSKDEMVFNMLWILQHLFNQERWDTDFVMQLNQQHILFRNIIRQIKQAVVRIRDQDTWLFVSKQRVLDVELEISSRELQKIHSDFKRNLLQKNTLIN